MSRRSQSLASALILVTQRPSIAPDGMNPNDRDGYMKSLLDEESLFMKLLHIDVECCSLTKFGNDSISGFESDVRKLVKICIQKKQRYIVISAQGHGSSDGWCFSHRVIDEDLINEDSFTISYHPRRLLRFLAKVVPKKMTFIIISYQCNSGLLIDVAEELKHSVLRDRKYIIQTSCSSNETTTRSKSQGVRFQRIFSSSQRGRNDNEVNPTLERKMKEILYDFDTRNRECDSTGLSGRELSRALIRVVDGERINLFERHLKSVTGVSTPQAMINGNRIPLNSPLVCAGPNRSMLFGTGYFGFAIKLAHLRVSQCPRFSRISTTPRFHNVSNIDDYQEVINELSTESIETAAFLHPNSFPILMLLGEDYLLADDFEKAAEVFRRAIRIRSNRNVFQLYARALESSKRKMERTIISQNLEMVRYEFDLNNAIRRKNHYKQMYQQQQESAEFHKKRMERKINSQNLEMVRYENDLNNTIRRKNHYKQKYQRQVSSEKRKIGRRELIIKDLEITIRRLQRTGKKRKRYRQEEDEETTDGTAYSSSSSSDEDEDEDDDDDTYYGEEDEDEYYLDYEETTRVRKKRKLD